MVDLSRLLATLHDATASLPDVDQRKMFGCEALFTRGAIFALVWKTGRIGVKLPDASRYAALASEKGTDPWRAGPMEMAHWLLVPPAIEADAKRLAPWVKEAHAMAKAGLGVKGKAGVRVKMEDAGRAAPSKPAAKKPAAKKPAAKKPAAKKPTAKKPAAKKPAAKKPAARKRPAKSRAE